MTVNRESHYEQSLQRDMEVLRQRVLRMALLDEGGLRNAVTALLNQDRQLAYTVILRDRLVDDLETELDRLCLEFLVRQQPVGGHLRFIFSTIKIIRELERVGDYAESIARQVLRIIPLQPLPPLDDFVSLADLAISMFHDSVQAFLAKDADLARQLMIKEDLADNLRNIINSKLISYQEQGQLALAALAPLMTVARRLERTTDQAKNVCEEVIYMTTGESIKHMHGEAMRIVFLDRENSGVSQMAEAIGRHHFSGNFHYHSAGVEAAAAVAPSLQHFMADKGIKLTGYAPKELGAVTEEMPVDIIILLEEGARAGLPKDLAGVILLDWCDVALGLPQAGAGAATAAWGIAFDAISRHLQDLIQAVIGLEQNRDH